MLTAFATRDQLDIVSENGVCSKLLGSEDINMAFHSGLHRVDLHTKFFPGSSAFQP